MKVAILAKGKTLTMFPGGDGYDEVWGLNQVGQSLPLSKLFVMDDLIYRLPHWTGPEFPEWLKTYPGVILTSRAYPEWPTSESFPLTDVAKFYGLPLGISYYSTVDYMLALAGFLGIERVDLFGVDCANPKREETVRASIAKWIGVLQGKGIKVTAPEGSFFHWFTVTGICYEQGLYGYAGPPRIEDLV